jgi:hypothetical protein
VKKKDLILALIKDDLINSKLVHSLNSIGLEADSYHLHSSITVMNLVKINTTPLRWEEIHDKYLDKVKKVLQLDIQESPRLVDALAQEIYDFLKKRRSEERQINGENQN